MMRNADWRIPDGLMLPGVVPFSARALPAIEVSGGPEIAPGNTCFFNPPSGTLAMVEAVAGVDLDEPVQ